MPCDIKLTEDFTAEDVAAIHADDTVSIKIGKKVCDHFHSTRQLFEILKSKQSALDVLLRNVPDVTLYVDYWTLYECRDVALDDKRTREMVLPRSQLNIYEMSNDDHKRAYFHKTPPIPETPLSDIDRAEMRNILQRFPNLYVEFSCTTVCEWDSELIGAWIGVIRTFGNISDLDTLWSDKYGYAVTEFLDDVAFYWGVKPNRIIRLNGSDNNFNAGYYNPDARYIAVADCGFSEGGWRELVDYFEDVDTCGPLIHSMAISGYTVRDSAACAEDFAYAVKYFPNVRNLRLDLSIESCTTDPDGVKVFEIPGLPELRKLSIMLNEVVGIKSGETLEIRIGLCPRIKYKSCYSYNEDINVRIV